MTFMSTHSEFTKARMQAIASYEILDTEAEAGFDELASLAALVCGAPIAAISFVCDIRQWFKAIIGISVRETPLTHSFCAHAIQQDDVFVVEDASIHPAFSSSPIVTGRLHARFYAGVPIKSADGIALGSLCIIDRVARVEGLTPVESETLRTPARQVEFQLELRRTLVERESHLVQQEALTNELHWVASHDILTQLPNRTVFRRAMDAAIKQSNTAKNWTVVLLIDVDHFKQVNDNLGHDASERHCES
jgi:GAF domain-containing protein